MTRNLTPDQLDEIEAVARECVELEWFEPGRSFDPEVVLALIADLRELRAKVERVRALHQANVHPDWPVSRCRDCDDVWPCETARALGEEA